MHRINFILVLLHRSWVYYSINSFYNWTCFGLVRNLGVTSLFLQQSLLCLICFMVCLNCSSPEDNRSLQCFKLNYRCCKVCSENKCKKGLLLPRQFVQGSYICHSYPVCGSGWTICPPQGTALVGVQTLWLQQSLFCPLCPLCAAAPKASCLPQTRVTRACPASSSCIVCVYLSCSGLSSM